MQKQIFFINPLQHKKSTIEAGRGANVENPILSVLPLLQDVGGVRGEAVDAPVGVAVGVADGDGEAAEVGPRHFDGDVIVVVVVAAVALEGHGVALAAVVRLVAGAVGGEA